MLEELALQAQEYISQRYLSWGLAAVGLLIGSVIIRVVDKRLAGFLAKVDYERTLEILWQRSVKIFLWVVLIILFAGNLGFDVTGFIAGLSVRGFVVESASAACGERV